VSVLGLKHVDTAAGHPVLATQAAKARVGLRLTYTALDRAGPDRVSDRKVLHLNGG
jgi:hypothetical protein